MGWGGFGRGGGSGGWWRGGRLEEDIGGTCCRRGGSPCGGRLLLRNGIGLAPALSPRVEPSSRQASVWCVCSECCFGWPMASTATQPAANAMFVSIALVSGSLVVPARKRLSVMPACIRLRMLRRFVQSRVSALFGPCACTHGAQAQVRVVQDRHEAQKWKACSRKTRSQRGASEAHGKSNPMSYPVYMATPVDSPRTNCSGTKQCMG